MRTAAYCRYSSDNQKASSIEDQLRNCRTYCERMGWADPVVYSDAEISGSRNDRPGYLRLLNDAAQFDVIIVDDLSRLSRDSIESATAIKRLTFAGVRVVGVSDGVDTARKGYKTDIGFRGLMSENFLDDLREKTHRGLTGRALAGASAGGLPYGYRITEVGKREPDPVQAEIVRRIFSEFLSGRTARQIAAGLNEDGIVSARGSSWAMTAIHGDVRRGIGILANPIYAGRQVWNRSRWVKHPDSGRRLRRERPASEWITTEHTELAIIDATTWNAVQARLKRNHRATGTGGRPMKYLLSGILRCETCGGPLVVVDRYRYGCSTAKDRGTCSSTLRVSRELVESKLIAGIQQDLLSDDSFQKFKKAAMAALKNSAPTLDVSKRKLVEAEKLQENILVAIRAGILTPSTKQELEKAEAAVRVAQDELAVQKTNQPSQFIPRMRELWDANVQKLAHYGRNVPAAREAMRSLIGESVILKTENGALFAEFAPCQLTMVAGVGFEPTTFGL